MTSQLYPQQAAAFEAASHYEPHVTNSTPTTPPHVDLDLRSACDSKKRIVENLPTHCCHCKSPLSTDNCLIEIRSGDIMAYCRGQGGCGKSQVLYVGIPLTVPKYKKVCVFVAKPGTGTRPTNTFANAASIQQFQQQQQTMQQSQIDDVYALHGITPPDTICATCGKRYDQHVLGYDSNGWVVDGEVLVELPDDWPVWSPAKRTWYSRRG